MFSFKTYLNELDDNINSIKLEDDIIETIIDPCIKYSKRLKNRDLFFIETNFENIVGPGLIIKNETESINVTRKGSNIFIPIDMFKCKQIVENEEIKTLKTFKDSEIIFETNAYFILNSERLLNFMNKSKFNKYKTVNEIVTYSDLINFLDKFKLYYNYRRGK